jgi:hypothetical protein
LRLLGEIFSLLVALHQVLGKQNDNFHTRSLTGTGIDGQLPVHLMDPFFHAKQAKPPSLSEIVEIEAGAVIPYAENYLARCNVQAYFGLARARVARDVAESLLRYL